MNSIGFVHDFLMRFVYESTAEMYDFVAQFDANHDYFTMETGLNKSFYNFILPPVSENCPTPLGVAGKKELPAIEELTK